MILPHLERDLKVLVRYAVTNGYHDWTRGDPMEKREFLMEIRRKMYGIPTWPVCADTKVPLEHVLAVLFNQVTAGHMPRPYANAASQLEAITKVLNGPLRTQVMERYYTKNPHHRPVVMKKKMQPMSQEAVIKAVDAILTICGNKPESLAGKNNSLYQYYNELLKLLGEAQNESTYKDGFHDP
jgi:hypothetical protein